MIPLVTLNVLNSLESALKSYSLFIFLKRSKIIHLINVQEFQLSFYSYTKYVICLFLRNLHLNRNGSLKTNRYLNPLYVEAQI